MTAFPSSRHAAPIDQLGRHLRDLRLSVIDACNLRCTYCMPENAAAPLRFLKRRQLLSAPEIDRLARTFAELGVRKVRLTGGEPLMRDDLPAIIRNLAAIPEIEDLALTTNGYWLAEQAATLRAAGLQRLTVSFDTLRPDRAADLTGQALDPQRILDGIQAADHAGFSQIKVNVVIMRDRNDDEILDLATAFRGTGRILRFIEYMDVGTRNAWQQSEVVSGSEILRRISAHFPVEPAPARWHGEVAKRYRYCDGHGEIGIITSVSQPFCRSCNRARVTADGQLYTCLFAESGTPIRHLLAADVDPATRRDALAALWTQRDDRYSEIREHQRAAGAKPVEMHRVGG